jgi:glucose/mannose transport system substrate-binding protein
MKTRLMTSAAMLSMVIGSANATELEVTHWWTSAGEAAALKVFADAFAKTGNTWVDAAIGGGGGAAVPAIVSRIAGGNPMGATVMVHGRQAEELVQAGLMRDLTELAEKEGWKDVVRPASLLDSCTFEGKIYCVPTNIHSQQWMWISIPVFEKAGVPVPKDWNEFVAAAPALEAAGIIPIAFGPDGFQSYLTFNTIIASVGGPELYTTIYGERDMEVIRGPEVAKLFAAMSDFRRLSAQSRVGNWNEASNQLITGVAAAQIMGDWAQAEFTTAGLAAGTDYDCLPGLGLHAIVNTGGNAFYFPVLEDAAASDAQLALASVMIKPEVQVGFNLAKGSLPVRGDVKVETTNVCMQKGLDILATGTIIPAVEQYITPDTLASLRDLAARFFADPSMTPEAAQEEYAAILEMAQ